MLLGLLLLFSNWVKEILVKKSLKWFDPSFLMWVFSLCTSLIVLPFVIEEGLPKLSLKFILAFVFGGLLYLLWKYCYFRALKEGELSYISPLKWLVTVWVVFTSWLLLWEVPSLLWIIWISVIVIGIYVLAIQKGHVKALEPIKYLFTDKWSRLYLVTVLAYSFTVSIDKIWVLETSPLFWTLCMNIFIFVSVLPSMLKNVKKWYKAVKKYKTVFITWIILNSGVYILHMYTIEVMLSSYVSAFKNSSSIIAVILWWILLKEKDLKKKAIAALIIALGVVCVVFA